MEIKKNISGANAEVAVIGRLDTTTAPQLQEQLDGLDEAVTALVLDMGELEYISSAGLRVLLAAQKTMAKKGSMKLINVNEAVMEVFEMTGFSDILVIE